MLVDILLGLVNLIISNTINFLPRWDLPAYLYDAVNTAINASVPIVHAIPCMLSLFICFTTILLFELTKKLVNIILGGISLLRGGGQIKME